MKHFFKTPLILLVALITLWSCSDDDDNGGTPPDDELNIVATAEATTDLSSLVAAITAADQSPNNTLGATLSAEGSFTVLAPDNDAFSDLFDRLDGFSSLADFDTTEKQDLLAVILSYHVVAGDALTSGQLNNGQTLTTVQGETLTVSTEGGVFFTDAAGEAAEVTEADEEATNGVIHIIDKVLIPQEAIDALNDALLFSITDLAISSNLNSLVAALQAADGDLPNVLRGDGPFTVLAPTDTAFANFLDGAELSEISTEVLTQVLLNHVISGEIESATLAAAGTGYASTSAAGPVDGSFLSIFYDATTDDVTFNGVSSVIDGGADIKASNGIVHVVDAVIELPSIADHATANSEFDNLVGALTDPGNTIDFVSVLSGTDEVYTVFAPVNKAFDDFEDPDMNPLQDILLNHVIGGKVALSGGLSNGYENTLATFDVEENLSIYINTDNDEVVLNGISTVALPDVVATNGVIHAVDVVIDLPTVVTFATADPTFGTLVAALTAEGQPDFVTTLLGAGPFTVFAPTNDAFQALLDGNDMWDGLGDIDADLLTDVLEHHVVSGNIRSGDLTPDGETDAPTLEGDDITITLPGTGDNIADVEDGSGVTDIGIIFVDVQANNGVIHVLNKVMIPDTDN